MRPILSWCVKLKSNGTKAAVPNWEPPLGAAIGFCNLTPSCCLSLHLMQVIMPDCITGRNRLNLCGHSEGAKVICHFVGSLISPTVCNIPWRSNIVDLRSFCGYMLSCTLRDLYDLHLQPRRITLYVVVHAPHRQSVYIISSSTRT